MDDPTNAVLDLGQVFTEPFAVGAVFWVFGNDFVQDQLVIERPDVLTGFQKQGLLVLEHGILFDDAVKPLFLSSLCGLGAKFIQHSANFLPAAPDPLDLVGQHHLINEAPPGVL